MQLNRSKDNKWILQKNISSGELFDAFLSAMQDQQNKIDSTALREKLAEDDFYKGRSTEGSDSTLGVRLSEMCFYMYGYKMDGEFIPSATTQLYLNNNIEKEKLMLINFFSLQFPHPYSNTPNNFHLYIGRLILKLLLDERINNRIYIDEAIWFLPFIEEINETQYEDLVKEIINYRKLSYEDKEIKFEEVANFNDVFSNSLHEISYYFFRIFKNFNVLNLVSDKEHNEGKLFKFLHGTNSSRNDAFDSHQHNSGYVELNFELQNSAKGLLDKFPYYEKPITQADSLTKADWIRDLYEFNQLEYINEIIKSFSKNEAISTAIKDMVYSSKYGSRDGKEFERNLKPVFELFREVRDVEIISGAGDTDLLCVVENEVEDLYKVNVDAKTSKNRTSSINPVRINNHIKKNGSKYCIIVSPKFSKGVNIDISDYNIVTIEAEVLANYCLKDCLSSIDGYCDYNILNTLIQNSIGSDISQYVDNIIKEKYQL